MKMPFVPHAVALPAVTGIAICLALTGVASAQSAAGKPSTPSANAAARSAAHHGASATTPPANAVARSLGLAGPAVSPAPPVGRAPFGSPAPSPAATAPSADTPANSNAMETAAREMTDAPTVAAPGARTTVTGAQAGRTPTPSPTGPIIVIPSTPPAP